MKTVFGPVPSRRLGQSLGIDPVPLKTCNWNCVYCQLGRSRPLVNERKEYLPAEAILSEVGGALAAHQPGEVDWVTFVGSGETTLHSRLGWLIREVKALTDLPVAVITNGSLLYLPEMRRELSAADAMMPSLDAGNPELYKKINRPHPEVTFDRLVDGLVAFRQAYRGKLWVEVMLVNGLNDTEEALEEISEILRRIGPDEVHILQPERPPVEPWVRPADEEGLLRARAILGDVAHLVHPAVGSFELGGETTLEEAVIGIITRHPMQEKELVETLGRWASGEVNAILARLRDSGKAQVVSRYGINFWRASSAFFPDDENHTSPEKPGA